MRKFMLGCTLFLTAGCGGSDAVRVAGRLTQGGAPLAGDDQRTLGVTFYKLDGQVAGEPYATELEPDGRFQVPGPEGYGIPKGKYRVALLDEAAADRPPAGQPRQEARGPRGRPPRRSLQRQRPPIVRDVEGPADLAIDVDKATIPAPGKSNAKAADAAPKKAARGDGLDHG